MAGESQHQPQPSKEEQQPAETSLELQASLKTAVQIALAADDVMMSLGAQATDAVCQAVRSALDSIWNLLSVREASGFLKDIPMGKKIKTGKLELPSRIDLHRVTRPFRNE